jgi:peptidyl-prolyl cis-trans isomerase SurA
MQMAVSFGTVRCALAVLMAAGALALSPVPAAAQVVVLVNGEPITAYDIEQRSRLMTLANRKQPARQQVIDELINDKLKLNIGKRYEVDVPQSMVDNAFANIARNAQSTPDQFAKGMAASGLDVSAFKARLRADIVWNQIVRGKFQSSLQVGDKDVATTLESRGKAEGDVGFEYRLWPVVFIVPRGSPANLVEARKREAEALRQRFDNCDEGLAFARALRDVAVRDPISRTSADLQPALRSVLDNLAVGKLTAPEVTSGGVEMFALCSKRQTTIDTPGKREVREEIYQQRFQAQAKRYLKELRKAAMIEYR